MGTLVFQANLGGSVNLIGPNTASTVNFTLPSADGTNGQALVTNGSGTLSFSSFVSSAAGSNTQVQFNSGGAFAGSANLTFDGTTLTAAGLSGPHNGSVGATTPSTGAFTTLSASSTITFSGGTANGVLYLNASKVAAAGTALTFDGSFYLGLTGAMKINSNGYKLRFYDATGATGYGYLYTDGTNLQFDSGNTQPLSFLINGSELMRLTSTGLGIGTSSPGYKLDVSSSGTTVVRSYAGAGNQAYVSVAGNAGVPGTSSFDIIQDGSSNTFLYNRANTYMAFGTNNTERMRLDSSGNLGLGVTPSASWVSSSYAIQQSYGAVYCNTSLGSMDVSYNSIRTASDSYVYAASSLNATRLQQRDGTFRFFTAPSGTAGNAITFTQAMTLDSSGNLLVGTTSAGTGAIVDVQSTTKGVRFPNMTTTQKNAITPAAGTVIFDTTLAKLCVYSGSAWQTITSV